MLSWKQIRIRIYKAIKTISDRYGGDDAVWLRAYCSDIIMNNQDDLEATLRYFEDYVKKMPIKPRA